MISWCLTGAGLESESEGEEASPSANGQTAAEAPPPSSTSRGRLKRLREPAAGSTEPQPGLEDLFGEPDEDAPKGDSDEELAARPMKRRNTDLFGESDEDI